MQMHATNGFLPDVVQLQGDWCRGFAVEVCHSNVPLQAQSHITFLNNHMVLT